MGKKEKIAKQPELPKVPRTLKEIDDDYARTLAQLGWCDFRLEEIIEERRDLSDKQDSFRSLAKALKTEHQQAAAYFASQPKEST